MCGQEKVRYIHIMSHPVYPDELRVGCICAGKISDDYVGAKNRDTKLKNKAARKKNWLTRQWRTSASGNPYLNLDGYNMEVFEKKAAGQLE